MDVSRREFLSRIFSKQSLRDVGSVVVTLKESLAGEESRSAEAAGLALGKRATKKSVGFNLPQPKKTEEDK